MIESTKRSTSGQKQNQEGTTKSTVKMRGVKKSNIRSTMNIDSRTLEVRDVTQRGLTSAWIPTCLTLTTQ